MPQLKGLHIDSFLTNLSVQYKNGALVNESLFPVVPVEFESDLYPVYSQDMMFRVYDTRRANGSRSAEVDWGLAPNGRYQCTQYSLRDIVTDRDVRNADKPLTVEIDTMEFVQGSLDLEKEYRAAQVARNTGTYMANAHTALSGTAQWSDYTSGVSHPYRDLTTAKKQIWTNARVNANTLILPYEVALTLGQHPDTIDRLKYTHPDLVTAEGIQKTILGMDVVVAGAGYNTANLGQAASIADIWGTDVVLAYVDPNPKLKSVSFGKTFRTTKYVKKWRDDDREGNIIEVNDINAIGIVANACGYLLQTVSA